MRTIAAATLRAGEDVDVLPEVVEAAKARGDAARRPWCRMVIKVNVAIVDCSTISALPSPFTSVSPLPCLSASLGESPCFAARQADRGAGELGCDVSRQ